MRITFPSSKILTRSGWYRRTDIPPGSGRDLRRDSYGIPTGSHAECLRYPATVLVKIPMGDRPEEKSVSAYAETCVSCTVYLFLRDHQEGNDNEHGPSKAKFNLKKKEIGIEIVARSLKCCICTSNLSRHTSPMHDTNFPLKTHGSEFAIWLCFNGNRIPSFKCKV